MTYRDPDLRERACELEAELNKLREENVALKKKRRWAWLSAIGRGVDNAWTWFWESGAFIVPLTGLLIAGAGIAIRHADRPHADATVDLNGRQAFALHCSNTGTECAVLAGRSCPHGYEVTKEAARGLLIVCKEEKK